MQQVSERMHLSAEEKNITLETDIASDLPPVQADPERLMQVMTNLVDNAIWLQHEWQSGHRRKTPR